MQMISCAGGSTPTVTLWRRDSLHGTVSGSLDGLTFHAQDLDPPAMLGDEYVGQWHIDAQSAAELAAVTTLAGLAELAYGAVR